MRIEDWPNWLQAFLTVSLTTCAVFARTRRACWTGGLSLSKCPSSSSSYVRRQR